MLRFTCPAIVLGCLVACAGEEDAAPSVSSEVTAAACTAQQAAAAYSKMVAQPIKPPRLIAGVDVAGGDGWAGASVDDAESVLCQSTKVSEDDASVTVAWGADKSVSFEYAKATRKLTSFSLNAGYKGALEFKSRSGSTFGAHSYTLRVGQPILRDGQPWKLNWKTACGANPTPNCFEKQATELNDALLATFAPDLPSTTGNCVAEHSCLARTFSSGDGAIGSRGLGIYFYVKDVAAHGSEPSYFYGFVKKPTAFAAAFSAKPGFER